MNLEDIAVYREAREDEIKKELIKKHGKSDLTEYLSGQNDMVMLMYAKLLGRRASTEEIKEAIEELHTYYSDDDLEGQMTAEIAADYIYEPTIIENYIKEEI